MSYVRTRIGRWTSLLGRESVYETPDALETESSQAFEISRGRVLFEEVLAVTYHREYGTAYLLLTGIPALMYVIFSVVILGFSNEAWPAVVVFSFFGVPLIIAFAIRAAFGVDVVNVFGRRSKATIRFRFRKKRAREVYGHVCALVRNAQREDVGRAKSPLLHEESRTRFSGNGFRVESDS